MALLVSSLPLSLTIIFGLPRATWATSFRRIGAPSDESAFRDELAAVTVLASRLLTAKYSLSRAPSIRPAQPTRRPQSM
jgi:hypothetical protein